MRNRYAPFLRWVSLVLLAGLFDLYGGGHRLVAAYELHRNIEAQNAQIMDRLGGESRSLPEDIRARRKAAQARIQETRAHLREVQEANLQAMARQEARVGSQHLPSRLRGLANLSREITQAAWRISSAARSNDGILQDGRFMLFQRQELLSVQRQLKAAGLLSSDLQDRLEGAAEVLNKLGDDPRALSLEQTIAVATELRARIEAWVSAAQRLERSRAVGEKQSPHFPGIDPLTGEVKPLPPQSRVRPLLSPPATLPTPSAEALLASWSDESTARIFSRGRPGDGSPTARELPTASDLAETEEIIFSASLSALVESLSADPLKIYDYVLNNIDFRIYSGAFYGAQGTFDARSGNDVDQATLLIALYRIAGIPARYETGYVTVPAAMVQKMTGIQDVSMAASALYTVGIPASPLYSGGKIASIKMKRTWVVAYLPYTHYRAAIPSAAPQGTSLWVRLDPSVKNYQYKHEYDLSEEVSFDVDAFLSESRSSSPLEFYEDQVRDYISSHGTGCETVDQAMAKRALTPTELGFLPNTLPFAIEGATVSAAALSASERVTLTLSLSDDTGTLLLEKTLSLPSLYGKNLSLTFPSGSGIFSASSGTVKPTLAVDGATVAQGSGLQAGTSTPLYVTPNMPGSSSITRDHPVTAGGSYAVMFSWAPVPESVVANAIEAWRRLKDANAPQNQLDLAVARAAALTYHQHLVSDDDRIYALEGWIHMTDYEAMTGTDTTALSLWGLPIGASSSGYQIDAENLMMGVPLSPDSSNPSMVPGAELSGYSSSFYEQKIWRELLNLGAFSSTSALQLAREEGQTIHYLSDMDDYNAVASQLATHDASVIANVVTALQESKTVVISDRPVTRDDKTCTGYILFSPSDGTGQYLINTRLDGGSTFEEAWKDLQALMAQTASIFSWVNLASGALLDQGPRMSFMADGRLLWFMPSYHSDLDHAGELGAGWTWNYGDSLVEDLGLGEITWLDSRGLATIFTKNSSGVFVPPPGVNHQLSKTSSGWQLTLEDRTVLLFDSAFHLLRKTDEYGNAVVLQRDSSGHPASLSTGRGTRLLTFTSDSEGHITRLTDASNLTMAFTFTDGRLTRITDFQGRQWDYVYSSSQHMVGKVRYDGTQAAYGYDSEGRVSRYTTPTGEEGFFAWDTPSRTALWTDPLKARRSFVHDEEGQLIEHIDAVGNRYELTYENGERVSVKSSRGVTDSTTYDASGRPLTHTLADGTVRSWTYDDEGRVLEKTDSDGTTTWTFDDAAHKVTIVDPSGHTTVEERNAQGLVTRKTVDGDLTTYAFNSDGNLESMTNPDGETTTYETNAAGRIEAVVSPEGHVATLEPDPVGTLSSYELEDGTTMTFSYTPAGDLQKVGLPDGREVRYTYEGTFLESVTDRDGRTTRYKRNANGLVTQVIDPLNNVATRTYDAAGRLLSSTDIYGQTTESSYCADLSATPCDIIDPQGNLIQREFDELGRVTTETSSLGTMSFEYAMSSCGGSCGTPARLTAVTDRLGNRTEYQLDNAGNVVSVLDALNHTTTYTFDATHSLTAITDPLGAVTRFSRSGVGRLEGVTDALGRQSHFHYDGDGLQTSFTDFNNSTTTFQYDDGGRISRETFSDGTYHAFTYDQLGNILTAINANASLEYHYDDPLGRVTEVVNHTLNETLEMSYDPATGHRATLTRSDGMLDYTYDRFGNPASVTLPDGQIISYRYDGFGRLAEKRFPNRTTQRDSYDTWGRLISRITYNPQGVIIAGMSYAYDALNRRASSTDIQGIKTSYQYDALGRLKSETRGTQTIAYTYDAVGNRLTTLENGVTVASYTYDKTYRLLTSVERGVTTTFVHDGNGNITSKTTGGVTTTYSYTPTNRLKRVTGGGFTPNEYRYDALGRRVYQSDSRETVHLLYDGSQRVLELTSTGSLARGYAYGTGIDEPLALFDYGGAGDTFYYHTDALGSVVGLSNAAGSLANAYQYGTFGALTVNGSEVTNPLTYTAQAYNQDTSSYDFRARQLDPHLGRFMQANPRNAASFGLTRTPLTASMPGMFSSLERMLSQPQALSDYVYALNSPLNYTDPSGEDSLQVCQSSNPYSDFGMGALGLLWQGLASTWLGVVWGIIGMLCNLYTVWTCNNKYVGMLEKIVFTVLLVLALFLSIMVAFPGFYLGFALGLGSLIFLSVLFWLMGLVMTIGLGESGLNC